MKDNSMIFNFDELLNEFIKAFEVETGKSKDLNDLTDKKNTSVSKPESKPQSKTKSTTSYQPKYNRYENHIDVIMPGYDKKDISIYHSNSAIEIKASTNSRFKTTEKRMLASSYYIINDSFKLTIPITAVASTISAKYEDGILTIRWERDIDEPMSIKIQ